MDLSNVNVIAELEEAGIQWEAQGATELRIKCPFHADNSPSCCVNTEKRVFQCLPCGAAGNFAYLLAGLKQVPVQNVLVDLESKYGISANEKSIDISLVEAYHREIWNNAILLSELYKRGVTDALVRKYRMGVYDNRVTIPIFNGSGGCVNIRRYLPGGPSAKKMLNTKGFGDPRPFPIEQLAYSKILLTGGECKAIVAADQLNKHGVGGLCFTKGEAALDQHMVDMLVGKEVHICMDVDKAGVTAARAIAIQLLKSCPKVTVIELPLDKAKYPKGDVNDYVATGGDLYTLIVSAIPVTYADMMVKSKQRLDDGPPLPVQLFQAFDAANAGKRVVCSGVVTAMDTAPYAVPKQVAIHCDKNQAHCTLCPVMCEGTSEFSIHPESESLLKFINASVTNTVLKDAIGIPSMCKVSKPEVLAYYNVEDVRLGPPMDLKERSSEHRHMPAYCIGTGAALNNGYTVIGRMHPHPKTSQAVLMVSEYTPVDDALQGFKLSDPEQLKMFQSGPSIEELTAKLDSIYDDLEANVTRIFKRRSIHVAVDLAYHSVLSFEIDGKETKGWTEILVIGDSSQGKTETAVSLQKHYRLGDKVDCKNASVAGLLGGLEQSGGSRWFVSWGAIPANDQRLVILEELKGASQEVLGKLTEMRSSGIASLQKIERTKTPARTRWLALSNPRSDLPMGKYSCGVEAIRELMGAPEDVRRFDHCLIVSASDIPADDIQRLQSSRPVVPHTYTSDPCNQLVLWAWTRGMNQTHFTPAAERMILDQASRLCRKYHESIPIVDRGSMRYKLARLSAAIAARVFSTVDFDNLIVHDYHVQYISEHLDRVYSASNFGYAEYSDAMYLQTHIPNEDEVRAELIKVPYLKDFIQGLMRKVMMDVNDVMDFSGLDYNEARSMIGYLTRKGCFTRAGRQGQNYTKSQAFIELLRNWDFGKDPPPFGIDSARSM